MDRVCPLLALAAERGVAIDGVDSNHRCHAEEPPPALDREVQAQLCLTPAHARCERYLAFAARTGAATPGTTRIGDGFVTTRLVLSPQPAWRGVAGRARTSRFTPWVGAGAVVAAAGISAAALAAPLLGGPDRETQAATTDPTPIATLPAISPPARTLAPTTQASTPSPSASSAPSPTATAAPSSPSPTAAPVVTPAPARTYTVAAGDTLVGIAQRFGTTPAAIQAANGIDDPDEIVIGQVLVIP